MGHGNLAPVSRQGNIDAICAGRSVRHGNSFGKFRRALAGTAALLIVRLHLQPAAAAQAELKASRAALQYQQHSQNENQGSDIKASHTR